MSTFLQVLLERRGSLLILRSDHGITVATLALDLGLACNADLLEGELLDPFTLGGRIGNAEAH
jgi:hypothetical protein